MGLGMTHRVWFIVQGPRRFDLWASLLSVGVVCLICVVEGEFINELLLTMRNRHLFEIINTNRKIKIFQNEKYNFTFHRAGPLLWNQPTNWPRLPVSTRTVWTTVLPMFRAHFWSLPGWKTFLNLFLQRLRFEYCLPWYLRQRNLQMPYDLRSNRFWMHLWMF